MSRRRTVTKFRRVPEPRIRYATTVICDSGHDFGVNLDVLVKFCGRYPTHVTCPFPCCKTPRAALPKRSAP